MEHEIENYFFKYTSNPLTLYTPVLEPSISGERDGGQAEDEHQYARQRLLQN